ncbi:hypothetical protein MRB53_009156 [Persea americana]|uniref:Uncharacterized protein n=1 Tax=Persea americana TaxID=3435 RepID=A0ACC2LPA6_PERAE|nr:hypothetical protein MRB53_009156 [Persea americana]
MATPLFSFIILLMTTQFKLTSAISVHDSAMANCPTKCGNVDIGLPFGIGTGCFLEGFEVICNKSTPYLSKSNLQLLEILPRAVRVNSTNFIAKTCFSDEKMGQAMIQLPEESPFTICTTSNILVNIGCNMSGSATTTDEKVVQTSCEVSCPSNEWEVNSACNGIGCCQTSLPAVRKNLLIAVEQFNPGITNCSYGFVVENGTYIFTESDLSDFNTTANISMRLEWSVGKEWNCSNAKRFLCGVNTQCHDSEDEHFCTRLQGYDGDPTFYGSFGCQG